MTGGVGGSWLACVRVRAMRAAVCGWLVGLVGWSVLVCAFVCAFVSACVLSWVEILWAIQRPESRPLLFHVRYVCPLFADADVFR